MKGIMRILLLIFSSCALSLSALAQHTFTVSGAGLPGSLTAPTTDQGKSLASISVNITTIVITNTDSSAHTVTIKDCQSTPFQLSPGLSIPAATSWTWNLNGIRFQGCFKWTANSTTVQGAVVGTSP